MNNREKILKLLKERYENFEGPISKDNVSKELDVSKETVRTQTDKLKNKGKIERLEEGGGRVYYRYKGDRSHEENDYLREIQKGRKKAKDVLGDTREPTLEETARLGNLALDDRFRRGFNLLKEKHNWVEPSKQSKEYSKEELEILIPRAAFELSEDYEQMTLLLNPEVYSPQKYAKRNSELLEKVEITENEGCFEMILPEELARFVDKKILFDSELPYIQGQNPELDKLARESKDQLNKSLKGKD